MFFLVGLIRTRNGELKFEPNLFSPKKVALNRENMSKLYMPLNISEMDDDNRWNENIEAFEVTWIWSHVNSWIRSTWFCFKITVDGIKYCSTEIWFYVGREDYIRTRVNYFFMHILDHHNTYRIYTF